MPYNIYKYISQLESFHYLHTPENIPNKEMITKAMKEKDDDYIQEIINNLFYQLFDLDGNRIDYLIKEYYDV
jgi:hypothetical protein